MGERTRALILQGFSLVLVARVSLLLPHVMIAILKTLITQFSDRTIRKKRQEKSSVESELNKLQDKTARIRVQQLFFAEGTADLSNILGKQFILALAHSTTQKMTTYR